MTQKGPATLKRLLETFQMVAECVVHGSEGLKPGGVGWCSVLRVRFLHTKVRSRIKKWGDRWEKEVYGVPINQEDMAVTLLAFSFNVLHGIELTLDRPLSAADQSDYLHLWRYIGWLMGLDDARNPCAGTVEEARVVLESIIMHQLEPDELSQKVAAHLLNTPHPNGADPDYPRRVELGRLYLGIELSKALALPEYGWGARFRASAEFWTLRVYSWAGSLPVIGTCVLQFNKWVTSLFLSRITPKNRTWALKEEYSASSPPPLYTATEEAASKCPMSC